MDNVDVRATDRERNPPQPCPRWGTSSPPLRSHLLGSEWSHPCQWPSGKRWRCSERCRSRSGLRWGTNKKDNMGLQGKTVIKVHHIPPKQREAPSYIPGQQCVQIVRSGWVGAQGRWGHKGSCLGPVFAPVVCPVSTQAGCDWLPKHNVPWERFDNKHLPKNPNPPCTKQIYDCNSWHSNIWFQPD